MLLDGKDLRFEDLGPLCNGAADAAKADNQDGLSKEGFAARTDPFTRFLVPDSFRNAAHPGKEKRHRMLGNRTVMDAVRIGEDDRAFHHFLGEKTFDTVRKGVYPADSGSCCKERCNVLEAPESDGICIGNVRQSLFRGFVRFNDRAWHCILQFGQFFFGEFINDYEFHD